MSFCRRSSLGPSLLALVFGMVSMLLTGCTGVGGVTPVASTTHSSSSSNTGSAPASIRGITHGGQQPVAGAAIQLYAANTTGDGLPATPLLSTAVYTDSLGNFNITGLYHCPSSTSMVYMVSTGGDPGSGSNNSNIQMMTLLGACGNLSSSTFVWVNEITTVAATVSLGSYMSSATAVGSSNAAGLAQAFGASQNIASSSTGSPNGVSDTYLQLANLMASCVNSSGASAACQAISAATGGATNILAALIYMQRHNTQDFSSLFNTYITPNSPFVNTYLPSSACPSGYQSMPGTLAYTVTTDSTGSHAIITSPMSGATITYTMDGTTASSTSPTVSASTRLPVTIQDSLSLHASAACYIPQDFILQTPGPIITDANATFSVSQQPNTTYTYTLNGVVPTLTSTPYTAAVPTTASDLFWVMAKLPGEMATANYVNNDQPTLTIKQGLVTFKGTSSADYGTEVLTISKNYGSPSQSFDSYVDPFNAAQNDIVGGCAKTPGRATVCTSLGSTLMPTYAITNGTLSISFVPADTDAMTKVYYTKDDTASSMLSGGAYLPGATATLYDSAVTLQMQDVVHLGAKAPGFSWSPDYNFLNTVTPTLTYAADGTLTMAAGTGMSIYYTSDGSSVPTIQSTKYLGSFKPNEGDLLLVRSKGAGYQYSPMASTAKTGLPTFTVSADGHTTMTDTTDPGAVIYYTTNPSATTGSWTKYVGTFVANVRDTYVLYAVTPGKSPSDQTVVATKTVTPPALTIGSNNLLSFTVPSGAGVLYDTSSNGSYLFNNQETGGTVYTSPFAAAAFSTVNGLVKYPGYRSVASSYTAAVTTKLLKGVMATLATCNGPVNALGVTRRGIVYAGCYESDNYEHVYRIAQDGTSIALFSFPLTGGSDLTLGMTVTPSGAVYIPDPTSKLIHRWLNGIHTTASTGSVAVDHLFTLNWEEALALDGNHNLLLVDPASGSTGSVTDGAAPTACAGGLVQNYVWSGIYCASRTAYLGANKLSDGSPDVTSVSVPGLVGGMTMEVDGTMLLATRSSTTTSTSGLYAITSRNSENGAVALQLTIDLVPTNSPDGQFIAAAHLFNPMSLAADPVGDVYVGQSDGKIRKLQYSQYESTAATPTIAVSGTTATITSGTAGSVIYYTLDGSIPTKGAYAFVNVGDAQVNAAQVSYVNTIATQAGNPGSVGITYQVANGGSITVPSGKTVRAIAVADTYYDSAIATQ